MTGIYYISPLPDLSGIADSLAELNIITVKIQRKVKKKIFPYREMGIFIPKSGFPAFPFIFIYIFILSVKKINPIPLTNRVMRYTLLCLIMLPLLAIPACSADNNGEPEPSAIKGVLDLSRWDFTGNKIIRLDGEWEFYRNRFIDPLTKPVPGSLEEPSYIIVPSWWPGNTVDGRPIASTGYASYRLKILIPGNAPPLSLKFRSIHTAYRAYINGRLISARGTAAETAAASRAETIYCIADLINNEPVLDLVIHVSNFSHKNGGIFISQLLGTEEEIHRDNDILIAINFFLFGSIIIIGFYYLLLFLLHREDVAFLFFCLFCILIAMRILVMGNVDYSNRFIAFSWDIIYHIAIITFYLALPVFSIYLSLLYPREFHRPVLYLIIAMGAIFGIIAPFCTSLILSRLVPFYDFFVIACSFYMTFIIILALKRKRQGSRIFISGYLIILLSIINDILYDNAFIKTGFLSPFGLLIFILFQTILLSQRFKWSFLSLEAMTEEFKKNNDHLLKVLINLRGTQELLIRQEKKAVVGNLASGLAHEIKNQLHSLSVLEFMNDKFNHEDRDYIRYILDSRDRINSMVDEVRALGKEEETSYTFTPVPLSHFLKETLVLIKIDPDVKNRHIMIAEHFSGEVMADKNKIIQVLLNLVRNAAQAIDNREKGMITIRTDTLDGMALIHITDNGTGISPEILDTIWEPFFTTKGEEGTGLGLHICRRIVEGHGGAISCESVRGEGTTFTFSLPLADGKGK